MEAEIAGHSLAAEAINEANNQPEVIASPDAGESSVESIGKGSNGGRGDSTNEKIKRKGSRMSHESSRNMEVRCGGVADFPALTGRAVKFGLKICLCVRITRLLLTLAPYENLIE